MSFVCIEIQDIIEFSVINCDLNDTFEHESIEIHESLTDLNDISAIEYIEDEVDDNFNNVDDEIVEIIIVNK